MDKPLAIWCMGLIASTIYLFMSGNILLGLFSAFMLWMTLQIIGGG